MGATLPVVALATAGGLYFVFDFVRATKPMNFSAECFSIRFDVNARYKIDADSIHIFALLITMKHAEGLEYQGRIWTEAMSFGLGRKNGQSWRIYEKSQALSLGKTTKPGEVVRLYFRRFAIPLDPMVNLKENWVVLESANRYVDDPAEPDLTGFVYAHSPNDIFAHETYNFQGSIKAARNQAEEEQVKRGKAEDYIIALDQLINSQDSMASIEAVYEQGRSAAAEIMSTMEGLSTSEYQAAGQKMKGFRFNRSEVLFVQPHAGFWLDLAKKRGGQADVLFFQNYKNTFRDGIWKIYVQPQTDYSGCTEFGDKELVWLYGKWTSYVQQFPGVYTSSVNELIKEIEHELTAGDCACYEKEKVLQEFELFLKTFPAAEIAPRIRQRIADIQNNESGMKFNCIASVEPQ